MNIGPDELKRFQEAADINEIAMMLGRYVTLMDQFDAKSIYEELFAKDDPEVSVEYDTCGTYRGPENTRAFMVDYRIADLRNYKYEEQMVRNGDKTEKKSTVRMVFINTAGMNAFNLEVNNFKEYEKLSKYFDTLFGVQKTLGNAANTWKQQMTAIKDVASGLSAAMRGQEDAEEKAASAINSLDAAIYGDRTEWIRRADAALAAFNG